LSLPRRQKTAGARGISRGSQEQRMDTLFRDGFGVGYASFLIDINIDTDANGLGQKRL